MNAYNPYQSMGPPQQYHHQQHQQQQPYLHSPYANHAPMHSPRESVSGPSRPTQGHAHRRDSSISYQAGPSSGVAVGAPRNTPYSRPPEARLEDGVTPTVKASSTTSEFTKRKNWSQHLIDEIQDFMHVLSPTGDLIFVAPSVRELAGWEPDDLAGKPIANFIHADDVEGFLRDFNSSLRDGTDLNLYYRFRSKDESYTIFEIAGHPYYTEENGVRTCKCFFGMGRPYPSKNTAMLDSFLELKMENERLRQELQVMYKEIEGGQGTGGQYGYGRDRRPTLTNPFNSPEASQGQSGTGGVIDQSTGLVQTSGLLPSSSNTYGALGIGISAAGTKGDGDKKKKKPRIDDGEFVCRDCGTVDSPEWRKGPEGPKSLCNACGLRYAKLRSKDKKNEAAAAKYT